MRKTYLRLGALLLMCASGMNSFAEKGDVLTINNCKYEIITPDKTANDASGLTVGTVKLLSISEGSNMITVGKGLVKEDVRGYEYKVVAIQSDTRKYEKGAFVDDSGVKGAFVGFAELKVTLGPDVEEILPNTFSFQNGSKVASVNVYDTKLKTIGASAFKGVDLISKDAEENDQPYDFSEATEIGAGAFESATLSNNAEVILTGIENKAIPDNLFKGVVKLKTVEVSNKLESVGEKAFQECTALVNLGYKMFGEHYVLPRSLKTVGADAFAGADKLTSEFVEDGGDITSVGARAFKGCTWLDNAKFVNFFGATIEKGVVKVNGKCDMFGANAFYGTSLSGDWDFSAMKGDTFGAGFAGTGIESAKLPGTITTIAEGAFMNANKLGSNGKSLDIPNTVNKIGKDAFTREKELATKTDFDSYMSIVDSDNFKNYYAKDNVMTVGKDLPYLVGLILEPAKKILGNGSDEVLAIETQLAKVADGVADDASEVAKAAAATAFADLFKLLLGNAYDTAPNAKTTELYKALDGVAPARVIRILPKKVEKNDVVQTFMYNETKQKDVDGGQPIANYANTMLYVPMGLQKAYAESDSWKNAYEGGSHLYTYKATETGDIYLGSLKYTIQSGWSNKYTGGDMTPEVKLTGICLWDKYTDKDGKEQKNNDIAEDKYTAVFSGHTLDIPATVVKPGENDDKPEYVYYTVVGVEKLNNPQKLTEGQKESGNWYKFSNLTEVKLPATLEEIGDNAFAGACLESVSIPASVKTIGHNAFDGKLDKDGKSFAGVRTFYLNWDSEHKFTKIESDAFGGVVQYDNDEQKTTFLPRFAIMETNAALTAFSNYGAPFDNKNMFQVGEGIAIQYEGDTTERFLNVEVTSEEGWVKREIGFEDANNITKLVVSKNVKAKVTYTRKFNAGKLQAWFVPFNLTEAPAGVKFYKIYDTEVDAEGNTSLELVEADAKKDTIKANVPYLVVSEEANVTFTADSLVKNNGDLKSVTVADVENKYTINGTYAYKAPKTETIKGEDGKDMTVVKEGEGFYGLKEGVFRPAGVRAYMMACRIYMTKTGNGSPYVKLHIMGDEEDETAILNMETGEVLSEPMYDLGGRRISSPVKGQIYIQGNVKKLAR